MGSTEIRVAFLVLVVALVLIGLQIGNVATSIDNMSAATLKAAQCEEISNRIMEYEKQLQDSQHPRLDGAKP